MTRGRWSDPPAFFVPPFALGQVLTRRVVRHSPWRIIVFPGHIIYKIEIMFGQSIVNVTRPWTHWIAFLRGRFAQDGQYNADVQESLVKSLYASPASLMIGAVAGGSLGLVVAIQAQCLPITIIAALIFLVGGLRSVSAVYFRRELAQQTSVRRIWGVAYEIGAWSYAALLGMLAFTTVILTDQASLHILSVCLCAAYAGGIAGRNAGHVKIAVGQTCLALFPTCVGLAVVGGLGYWVLAMMLFLMIFAMAEITKTTNHIVLQALQGQFEKTQLAAKFERLARFDSLTGVENRMAMHMHLRELFEQQSDNETALAILWTDMDRFKEINDTLGHIIGDQLLCQVAERLTKALDGRGHVARFGGDEFILICPGADEAAAMAISNDIMAEFAYDFLVGGYHLSVTASAGLSVAPRDGAYADELLQHADMALYQAKHQGRNRYARFDWSMKEKHNRIYDLEQGLRSAITNGEMTVQYQPIFDTETGQIAMCEALLRWTHPQLGPVSPAEFIPIAESTSQIQSLTTWVLEQACQAATQWDDHVRIAVNISPSLIKTDGLADSVIAALLQSGLAASRLELEVTESIFLEDSGRTSMVLSALQKIGLRLALDDFGTGYSSLSYLRDYAFDTIKVDQSFMRGIGRNTRDQAIARSVADLARSLQCETVAEGIENEEQLSYARAAGFTNVQGFMLCRPVSREALIAIMERKDDSLSRTMAIAKTPPRKTAGQ